MASGPPQSKSDSAPTPLRIVFMGTPALAAHILTRLIDSSRAHPEAFQIAGVVTRPDRPRGRGLAMAPSEVAAVADRNSLAMLKPAKIRTPEFLADLRALAPDLLLIAAYGRILPDTVLEAARLMPLNVHASLLPRHRGAAPIEGAILAGDAETGVTIMRVTSRMDSGPILLRRAIPILPDDTQGMLKEKLAELGATAALDALEMIRRGTVVETPQDESLATYSAPVTREDSIIDWDADAAQIERMTRAYDPWPIARTKLAGGELLIWRAEAASSHASTEAPGTILSVAPEVTVRCGRGRLTLLEVQAPGRKRLRAADFVRGRRLAPGARLG